MTTTQTLQPVTASLLSSDHRIRCPEYEDLDVLENEALRHPLGVRPGGNALTSDRNLQVSMGAFKALPDAMIVLLLEYFDQESLVALGGTCRAFFAFATYDQLWRDIAVDSTSSRLRWRGSWRATTRKLPSARLPEVDCQYLFSDALYRPFLCSQINLKPYVSNIHESNRIPRLGDLSATEFNTSWTNRPFILTNPVKKWRIYDQWCQKKLVERYADINFRAEAVDWPLKMYIEYLNNNEDESPLYLFDRGFVEKMDLTVAEDGDYQPPECFQEDLFTVLGKYRPDHRWLIIGPERSGSTFHKDPNATSAWNAVIRGSKYWIMFPNAIVPPGVYMSDDQSEVTSPLSIAEWLLSFHAEARNTLGCLEGICREGEVLHVPSGWWHLVVNLEPAIAITQNFVPRSHLSAAIVFLRHKADQVSGFQDDVADPLALFMERMQEVHPLLLADLETSKKRKWEEVVGGASETGDVTRIFSFGFGDLQEEDP